MQLGYYFANSKYGLNYWAVKSYAPIYRTAVLDFKTSENRYTQAFNKFRSALTKACEFPGTKIVLALDWMSWANEGKEDEVLGVIEHVDQLKLWDRVIAVEIGDEVRWSEDEGRRVFEIYESGLRQLKLHTPHYGAGIVENEYDILYTQGWSVFDWVGLEGYVDPPGAAHPK